MENVFPEEIRNGISGLGSEVRQKIVSYLMLNGEAPYSTLKEKLDLSKGNINYHLGALMKSGLVMNYIKPEKSVDEYNSYYKISDFGKSFINSLFMSLTPQPERYLFTTLGQTQRIESKLELLTRMPDIWAFRGLVPIAIEIKTTPIRDVISGAADLSKHIHHWLPKVEMELDVDRIDFLKRDVETTDIEAVQEGRPLPLLTQFQRGRQAVSQQ